MTPAPIGRFEDRIRLLEQQVGGGKLEIKVVVDQIYAKFQHERLDLRHPSGGGPKYLTRALYGAAPAGLQHMARAVLDGHLREAAVDVAERVVTGVYENAPFEFGDLRASGAPTVKDGGRIYYRRPPNRKRLTKSELRAKSYVRRLGFGNQR